MLTPLAKHEPIRIMAEEQAVDRAFVRSCPAISGGVSGRGWFCHSLSTALRHCVQLNMLFAP
jgi:hypothetical protein